MASHSDEFTLIDDATTTTAPNFHHHHNHLSSAVPPPPNATSYNDLVTVTYENDSNKRIDQNRDELSDGGTTPYSYNNNKKAKISGNSSDYRKDREEWSDAAIACLLDAYLDKFLQLNRGNLRVRDWEEVAVSVSDRCENQSKSVEQCKNKVDNLKKRFKLERNRIMNTNGGNIISHWPWYSKMEMIVGNALPLKTVLDDDNKSIARQSKRYTTATSSPSGQITNMEQKSVTNARWRRVIFKISGAALSGTGSQSIDPKVAMLIAREVSIACQIGVEVAIVVGGSNFFCGDTWVAAADLDRSTAYQIG